MQPYSNSQSIRNPGSCRIFVILVSTVDTLTVSQEQRALPGCGCAAGEDASSRFRVHNLGLRMYVGSSQDKDPNLVCQRIYCNMIHGHKGPTLF